MKNTNKKGFTLVELVIVIAVIAILAGVLIGTFATVISRANQNSALQKWKAAVDEAYVNYVADKHVSPTFVSISETNGTIAFDDGSVDGSVSMALFTRTGTGTNDDPYVYTKQNTNLYFVLDSTNKVYLIVNNESEDKVTYSVIASNDTPSDASLLTLYSRTTEVSGENIITYTDVDASGYKKLTYSGNTYCGQ